MNQRIQDVLTCPICFELYRKPVLTLPCQHNFCRSCLLKLVLNELHKNGCPTCRFKITLITGNVDELPRNLIVEQMVAEFETTEPKSIPEKDSKDDDDSDTLLKLAALHMEKLDFDKAKNVYKTLEASAKGVEAIQIKIEIFKCCVQSQESDDVTTKKGAAIGQALANEKLSASDIEEVTHLVLDFVKKYLVPQNFQKIALVLISELSDICELIPDPKTRLEKHMNCLDVMQGVARSMTRNKKKNEFKVIGYEALTRIYRNATRAQLEDKNLQCIKVSWCLKYIGVCYNEAGDFAKSLEYNERSINHLKKRFGEDAIHYRLFGIAYHNLAAAYKNLKNFSAAQEAYLTALNAYHLAKDWPSLERRNNSVILSASGLTEAHRYIK